MNFNEKQLSFLRMQVSIAFRSGMAHFEGKMPDHMIEAYYAGHPAVSLERLDLMDVISDEQHYRLYPNFGIANAMTKRDRVRFNLPTKVSWQINLPRNSRRERMKLEKHLNRRFGKQGIGRNAAAGFFASFDEKIEGKKFAEVTLKVGGSLTEADLNVWARERGYEVHPLVNRPEPTWVVAKPQVVEEPKAKAAAA